MSFLSKVSGLDLAKGLWKDFTGQSAVDQQNAANLKMWQMQNEYNTPANQMARYREAGLNPNLIYGEGKGISGNATSAPEMQAHQSGFNSLMNLLSFVKGAVDVKTAKDASDLNKLQTLSGIEHSRDVLELEKKKMMIDSFFRDKEFDFRKHSSDRDYLLRKAAQVLNVDKWNYEKEHIGKYGTKPGTPTDFLNRLLGNTLGKPVVDVGEDFNHLINSYFRNLFKPVTADMNIVSFGAKNFLDSLVKDMVKGFAGQGQR